MNDYYNTLGVGKKASLSDIKRAYRKLARKHHPDLNPNDKIAEKKFKEITEAYEILSDPEKRKQYDMFGAGGGHFRRGKRPSGFDGFDFTAPGSSSFGDIFETIFGSGAPSQGGAGRAQRQPERGEDLRYAINLSFIDSTQGLETPIQLTRKELCTDCGGKGIDRNAGRVTCADCGGTGQIQKQTGFMRFSSPCNTCGGSGATPGKTCGTCGGDGRIDRVNKIRVRIPAGVDHDSRVKISGKGNVGRYGGPAGDLLISIDVTAHKFFERNGANLEVLLPITYLEAALGGKVEVPTLDGSTMLKIPPGTTSAQKLRLRGKGIIDPKTRKKGDMVVEIKIVPPPTTDIEVRRLLKKIEKKAPYNPRKELEL